MGGGAEATASPSSILILQLHPHKGAHTGNVLNAKDDFSCQTCGERWGRSSESDHVSAQATVDGLSGDVCGLARFQWRRGTGSGPGCWADTSAPVSQPTIRPL